MMARRIANSVLNASTIDILNVIRSNASYDYQQSVPAVEKATDIPKVGEIIYGTPAFANQFINALVNRIALVRVKSANFNNPYNILKKGYLEFGETVEDIFVSIAKVVDYDPEKAPAREFQRTLPDVRSAFHTMNWRVMYPVTIQDNDLKLAFLSEDGMLNLISKIVDSVYTAAEYDEFLLFKYMLIKAISHGKMYPKSIGDGTNLDDAAKAFRGTSNLLPFMKNDFNEVGVRTSTPKDKQVIFMDAQFNADYDVSVLASAFNMDKADFMGRLFLIDDWTTFDNERFEVIKANSDGIEDVTADELSLMEDVKAVLLDEDWFQVYDNLNKFTEEYVSSGLYWNYFYHTWKTVSNSPFSNAVVFCLSSSDTDLPASITVHVDAKDESDVATVFTISPVFESESLSPQNVNFIQTEQLTTDGIAIQRFGGVIIPASATSKSIQLTAEINGTTYQMEASPSTPFNASTEVDTTFTLTKKS